MPNDASVLAFCWHLKCHFERRNALFWHFKSNKGTETKKKWHFCLHVFYSVFSIRYKICKFCRILTLRQKVSVLMTAVFEILHAFHCLIRQSWTWGNHLFNNNSKKMIPWNVTIENTMERLLKIESLWANAKCQMQVYNLKSYRQDKRKKTANLSWIDVNTSIYFNMW